MNDTQRDYEIVVIAAPSLDDEGLANLNQKVTGWIEAANGTVSNVNVWGRRQLLFAIKRQTEGIYVVFSMKLLPSATRDLERNLRIEELVIRHLVVRLDED